MIAQHVSPMSSPDPGVPRYLRSDIHPNHRSQEAALLSLNRPLSSPLPAARALTLMGRPSATTHTRNPLLPPPPPYTHPFPPWCAHRRWSTPSVRSAPASAPTPLFPTPTTHPSAKPQRSGSWIQRSPAAGRNHCSCSTGEPGSVWVWLSGQRWYNVQQHCMICTIGASGAASSNLGWRS